ncbi:MAG TPA: hypothetical protein DCR71_03300 [Dehalococcoidia bacterium]|nr:hypothetical protein [Dehalococcoidia bacterium]
MINRLRPYQKEIAVAVLDSIFHHKGITFSIEIARQGGKNELSAQLELLLLTLFMSSSKNLIKCAPTFKPQALISMARLKDRLNDVGFGNIWTAEQGYIIKLGYCRAVFLSAEQSSNVVGNTAHLLLEIDESQDIDKQKYNKDFKPMGSTTNVTTVHYGTAWDDATLLEEVKQNNLELERKDGIKRHFRYDWQEIAKYNPDYLSYIEAERIRLGENHPLFRTQYCLLPIRGGGGFFDNPQRAQLQGDHPRRHRPQKGKTYIAGIDIAGEATDNDIKNVLEPKRDSTVITIGELDYSQVDEIEREPQINIVEHYGWTGKKHTELYPQMVDILGKVWGCRRIVIDATGIGLTVSSFLRKALGARVIPFTFTSSSKSQLGFNLLAAVNTGRLKMYLADGSREYIEFWQQAEKAKSCYRPNQTINFFVDPSQGHDDFLMSLALLVEAGKDYAPRKAKGNG